MKRAIIILTIVFLLSFLVSVILYYFGVKEILSLVITLGIFCYHIVMRLLVSGTVNVIMRNKADYNKKWYRVCEWEIRLYEKLAVKKWKNVMPTYESSFFDIKKHSLDEVLGAMCQAEIVHEIIAVLSLLPIFAGIWFDEHAAFIVTSVVASLFDLSFVIIQRYNRPRILKIKKKRDKESFFRG